MGNKIKTGQNKYWDLQSVNLKIVSLMKHDDQKCFLWLELFSIVSRGK